MSDRDDLQNNDEKSKTSNFMVIDEPEEKPKGKGKPKRRYLPDHLVVNTKLVIGFVIIGLVVIIFIGLFAVAYVSTTLETSQSSPLVFYQSIVTATPLDSNSMPITPSPYIIIPTPTMRFDALFQNWKYPVILTRAIGDVPANTRVTIQSAYFNGTEWLYTLTPETGGYLERVPESALMPAEDLGTQVVVTPGALFNDLIGMGVYWAVTTTQVGDIPINTPVRISTASYDGTRWIYDIATEGDTTFAKAEEWQLAFAPGVTPGAPTPTIVG
jgi:hypothetical protein